MSQPLFPAELLGLRDDEVARLRAATGGRDLAAAMRSLQAAAGKVFAKHFGIPEASAGALARLMAETSADLHTMIQRCAMQRALVRAGVAASAASLFLAAGRGAEDGYAASSENFPEPDAAPRLTARPRREVAPGDFTPSSYFATGLE
jgi:hypothetical protein